MSDDKQKEVLSGYEQLKRRNRRRLVTTSALVFVSGILLAMAVNTGSSEEKNGVQKSAEKPVQNVQGDVARATVLEPDENNGAPDEIAENSSVSEPPVEVLRPQAPQAPEDVGPPLVIINDKLVDSDIKGLEESEKIQKAEAAKREAQEKKQQAQIQRQTQQHAAKRDEERKAALAMEKEAAERKRMAAKANKAEREAAEAKRMKEQEAAQRRARQVEAEKEKKEAVEKVEAVKSKAPEDRKKTVTKDSTKNTADSVHAKAAGKPSEKVKSPEKAPSVSKERSAIQAGYAEKERAQSLQRKMKAAGINASITEIKTDKGVVYRVKSSAYKSRQEAARDLEKLRVHGIAGQVVNE